MKYLAIIFITFFIAFLWLMACYMSATYNQETDGYGLLFIPTIFFTLCYFFIVDKLFRK